MRDEETKKWRESPFQSTLGTKFNEQSSLKCSQVLFFFRRKEFNKSINILIGRNAIVPVGCAKSKKRSQIRMVTFSARWNAIQFVKYFYSLFWRPIQHKIQFKKVKTKVFNHGWSSIKAEKVSLHCQLDMLIFTIKFALLLLLNSHLKQSDAAISYWRKIVSLEAIVHLCVERRFRRFRNWCRTCSSGHTSRASFPLTFSYCIYSFAFKPTQENKRIK